VGTGSAAGVGPHADSVRARTTNRKSFFILELLFV